MMALLYIVLSVVPLQFKLKLVKILKQMALKYLIYIITLKIELDVDCSENCVRLKKGIIILIKNIKNTGIRISI